MDLYKIYSDLLLNIGFEDNEIQKNWASLENTYCKKSRHYHNLNHLKEMIELFDDYQSHLKNYNEILFSIFYHDYIYKASKKDNELKSAEFALSILNENHTLNKQLVFDAICATQLHAHNANEDINWLIDFDLKILAKDWDDYKIYFEQIRKEYRIYPDFLYKPGRAKALKHFLENEFIFQTDEFRNLYEEKARQNIETEISYLERKK